MVVYPSAAPRKAFRLLRLRWRNCRLRNQPHGDDSLIITLFPARCVGSCLQERFCRRLCRGLQSGCTHGVAERIMICERILHTVGHHQQRIPGGKPRLARA